MPSGSTPSARDQLETEAERALAALASELRAHHQRTALSLRALARDLYVSSTTLHRYLHGQALPSSEVVDALVRVCDGDPAATRALWQDASLARRRLQDATRRPAAPARPAAEPDGQRKGSEPEYVGDERSVRRRHLGITVVGAAAMVLSSTLLVVHVTGESAALPTVEADGRSDHDTGGQPGSTTLPAPLYPVPAQSDAPSAEPLPSRGGSVPSASTGGAQPRAPHVSPAEPRTPHPAAPVPAQSPTREAQDSAATPWVEIISGSGRTCVEHDHTDGIPRDRTLMSACAGGDSHLWRWEVLRGDVGRFVNKRSGECLDQSHTDGVARPDVLAFKCVPRSQVDQVGGLGGGENQAWRRIRLGDGRAVLRNELSRRCMAYEQPDGTSPAVLRVTACDHTTDSQRWLIATR